MNDGGWRGVAALPVSALAVLVPFAFADSRLAVRAGEGAQETVATGIPAGADPLRRNLVWAADGTIFVPIGADAGVLLRLDGAGPPPAATPGP